VNSRWTRAARAVLVGAALWSCRGDKASPGAAPGSSAQAQQEAEQLGREVADIVDRVMAYRSSHRGNLPVSYRQAGLDSLTPQFVRRLARQGNEPLVTIAFRRTAGRAVASCDGTNLVLEDKLLRAGAFDVSCRLTAGGTRIFTVPPPPPPKEED
jgi:hypothetical protein